MMQLDVFGLSRAGAHESQTVMVRVTPKEGEASGLELFGINVRDFEPQDLSVKSYGTLEVAHL